MPLRVSSALALLALAGCSAVPSGPPSGLRPIARLSVDGADRRRGHSREVVVDGDLVFTADANGLPIARWRPDGGLALLHPVSEARIAHCSSLALHAASRTLLCTSTDQGFEALVDVSDPSAPIARPWPDLGATDPIYSVPDAVVEDDVAWLAAFDDGLLRVTLGADGTPTSLTEVPSGGAVVAVALLEGDRLAYLDRGEGLVVLDRTTLERLGQAPVEGPAVGLHAAAGQLFVSLGSEGLASFRLDDAGAPVADGTLVPGCVVTDVDREGDALAVACLSGVLLYDLRETPPRPASYLPAVYGVLDVELDARGLLVVDWYDLASFAVDLDRAPTVPDAPRGMRLRPGEGARVPLRNPGAEPLDVQFRVAQFGGRTTLQADLVLGPGGTEVVDVPAGAIGAGAELIVEGGGLRSVTTLLPRTESDRPTDGAVAIGDAFPRLARVRPSAAPEIVPTFDGEGLVMFLTVDCFLQWPQLEDMAWQRARGRAFPEPLIFYLSFEDADPFDPSPYLRPFGAEALAVVEWADYQGSVPTVADEPVPSFAFDRSFSTRLPGADFPHDYRLDAAGIATATSRMYRGRWPLGE